MEAESATAEGVANDADEPDSADSKMLILMMTLLSIGWQAEQSKEHTGQLELVSDKEIRQLQAHVNGDENQADDEVMYDEANQTANENGMEGYNDVDHVNEEKAVPQEVPHSDTTQLPPDVKPILRRMKCSPRI
ncbi:uncharacterized protein VTP21DRAFT_2806 [Calcarisporiella thermophila]|uniref:uncharacterized protein n=1 Tax=Calcarisporiella thermophila TaxID=911321 RepID=UPI003742AE2D